MKVLVTVLVLLVLAAAGGAAYVYSGALDVSADTPHSEAMTRLLTLARERAIAVRTKGMEVPKLDDPERIAAGASEYAEMCAGCHLAPGMEDNELRPGLYPKPPELAQDNPHATLADAKDDAARQFWIIKHGIKMSSMPAWGTTHDDETLWNIVAFVRKLPELTPEQYAAMTVDSESTHEAAGHGDAAHDDDHDEPAPAADNDHAAHHHHH